MYTKFYKLFSSFRAKINTKCSELMAIHGEGMNCKISCSSCCQAFKVLPLEFHLIQEEIQNRNVKINDKAKPDECKFLVDHACSIYDCRPIICRTHGFPLARFNDEADAYEISYCKLNFINYHLDDFKNDNVFYEDDFNDELYKLNKEFILSFAKKKYDFIELLEINNINVDNSAR